MPWLKIIHALFIVAYWAKAALKDGRITLEEAINLILKLAKLLGLPTVFNEDEFSDQFLSMPDKESK